MGDSSPSSIELSTRTASSANNDLAVVYGKKSQQYEHFDDDLGSESCPSETRDAVEENGKSHRSSFRHLCIAMARLWPTIFLGGVALGVTLPLVPYISLNFFASEYTDLPKDQIHCELDTNTTYCKEAVADNVRWTGISSFASSVVHFLLGPTVGILSDSYGRKPLICLCAILALLPLAALFLYVNFYVSLYLWYVLLIFEYIPVIGVWFALITDLVVDTKLRAAAFGLVLVAFEVAILTGMIAGSLLLLRAAVFCCVILTIANVAYLVLCFRESLPIEHRKPLVVRQLAPGIGLSILARNANLVKLSIIFFVSTLAGEGLNKIGTSFLQRYFNWSQEDNYSVSVVGQISVLLWVGGFLRPLTACFGEVGLLFIGQIAGGLFCVGMCWVSSSPQVFLLNGICVGAMALAFPATAALKGSLVDDSEQGHVQGAVTTMKSVAAALGPIFFGAIFNATADWPAMGTWSASFIWMIGAILYVALLPVIWNLPRDVLEN